MDKNLVSVIMPAFNSATFIKEGIESVVNQTYTEWELIVVDDGSVDHTAAIIQSFTTVDKRIKYLHQENGKQGKARNFGIKNSEGSYIAFLDADDTWTPDKLSVQMAVMLEDRNVDLIFSQGYLSTNGIISDCDVQIKSTWTDADLETFIDCNQIPILSVIIKRKILEKVNLFNESLRIQNAEDYHLWLKLLIAGGTFKSISNRLFYYRVHATQSTYQNKNLVGPIFSAFENLFFNCEAHDMRRYLINKLKWFIFDDHFYLRCVKIFKDYFKKKALLEFILTLLVLNRRPLNKKIIFKLVSKFG